MNTSEDNMRETEAADNREIRQLYAQPEFSVHRLAVITQNGSLTGDSGNPTTQGPTI